MSDTVTPAEVGHGRIAGLDGLRGVAAMAILAHHIGVLRHESIFFSHGYLAVDFFFLLSGFVIGGAYEPRMAAGMTFWRYAQIRLIRLYPLIALGAVAGAVSFILTNKPLPVWTALWFQLAFIPFAVTRVEAYPLNGVQWSLFFELFINAVHAALYRFLTTRRLVLVRGGRERRVSGGHRHAPWQHFRRVRLGEFLSWRSKGGGVLWARPSALSPGAGRPVWWRAPTLSRLRCASGRGAWGASNAVAA